MAPSNGGDRERATCNHPDGRRICRLITERRLREERDRKTERAKLLDLERDRAPTNRNEVYARYLRQCSEYKTPPLPREVWEKARDEQMKSGGLYWHA